jgi:hypothetical protein
MKPVVQEERTGCGIASVAALAGVSYAQAKARANMLGISASDARLWSETGHVRSLLAAFGMAASGGEQPFVSWKSLPDRALLAIKWHRENGRPYWHWVAFIRDDGSSYVLDSKQALKSHTRTDFGRMNSGVVYRGACTIKS